MLVKKSLMTTILERMKGLSLKSHSSLSNSEEQTKLNKVPFCKLIKIKYISLVISMTGFASSTLVIKNICYKFPFKWYLVIRLIQYWDKTPSFVGFFSQIPQSTSAMNQTWVKKPKFYAFSFLENDLEK